jgi:hypothetical protein
MPQNTIKPMKRMLTAIATATVLLGFASISYTNYLEQKRTDARRIQLQGDCRFLGMHQEGTKLRKRYLESHPEDLIAREYVQDSVKSLQTTEAVCDRVAEWERRYGEKFYP